MPAFLQITDTHIVAPGALACGRSDTAAALTRAIETINAKLPVLGDVSCVIITGDLTDHGTPEEYAHFSALMAPLALPWLAVPGNHDRRAPMRAAFAGADWLTKEGPIQWHRDFGPFSLIGLDTLLEGAHHGDLCDDGFALVDQVLNRIGDQPVIIATHHPWMPSAITTMDADNIRNGAALMARLAAHPGPVRMISGHVHRAMTTQIGRITCQIAPATGHAVDVDLRPGVDNRLTLEPGGVTLYTWLDAPLPCLVSDVIPTGDYPGPYPFQG
ncbi:phosphodiesterase [Celeribacter sp. SCSIO 80788]|uniref:phosphodiesterase n=1 Tax=Celeribacter sp. SCSIO 80788 TaxID=3117013 RepID=UPI003DA57365